MDENSNGFSEETLAQIEEYAALFYPLSDISLIIEVEFKILKASFDAQGIIYRRYMKGKLISALEIRKSIIEHAKSGSSPAQQMALKIMLGAESLEDED